MSLPDWKSQKQNSLDLPTATIDLWLIELNPPKFEFPDTRSDILSSDELERAARFRFDRHRRQYIAGRRALRRILSKYTGQLPEKVEFEYGEYGKPYLKNNDLNIEFNLSNSHDTALVAMSADAHIGADIEFIERKMWDIDSLAKTVFTNSEIDELNLYLPDERLIPFLSGWTRKEAYLKAIGKGLALPLKDFSVQLKNELEFPAISTPEWQLFSFWSDKSNLSAIAYPSDREISAFRWFKLPASDSI